MKPKFCIVQAKYYSDISSKLYDGAIKTLGEELDCKIISVPGVFEIPFMIAKNIESFDGFIALGCVIKGTTPHFDYISTATINAIMDLSIQYKKPIGNGIITCLNKKQALERADPTKKDKGGEAAKAVLSVLEILNEDKR
jgi:6,7-dimethyl-8-ribityllumazine synthase